jgi:hypothetical protein
MFKEAPCLLFSEPTGSNRLAACVFQSQVHRALLALWRAGVKQRTATRQECGKGCGMIVCLPPVEGVPVDGLEC